MPLKPGVFWKWESSKLLYFNNHLCETDFSKIESVDFISVNQLESELKLSQVCQVLTYFRDCWCLSRINC